MVEWWSALSDLERFFALVAVPSTLLLLIQTVLLLLGMGGHGHDDANLESDTSGLGSDVLEADSIDTDGSDGGVDFDRGHDHSLGDHGLRIFTMRGFIAFFSIFGWCGLACLQGGIGVPLAMGISILAGIISMMSIAILLKGALKLQSTGTVSLTNAVGKSGTVYIRIPASRAERGKVNLLVQESFIEADALTDETFDLQTGREVTVVGLANPNTLLVAARPKQ